MNDAHKHRREKKLEKEIADLKARLPAHSVPPTMMMELDELEEQLAQLRANKSSLGKSLESLPAPVSGAALAWNPPRGRGSEHFPRDLNKEREEKSR